MKNKCNSKNLAKVLANLQEFAHRDKRDMKTICAALNEMLDNLCSMDFFGTEAQCDPRGDQRD
jgi:hypothetical protein